MNFEMMDLLGQTSSGISGEWVLQLIGKIFGGLAVLITAIWAGYKKGQKAPETETTIKNNPFKVTEVKPLATKEELKETEHRLNMKIGRVEAEVESIRDDQKEQFRQILESGAAREARIGDKIDATARATHERIDRLLRDQANHTKK